MEYLLYNGILVTGQKVAEGALHIEGDRIRSVIYGENTKALLSENPDIKGIDLNGKHVFAGGIDAHVHFREPGMTHKADIESESKAAVLGGVTSFIDMPNTKPPTISEKSLHEKLDAARNRSFANFGFHIGATDDNFGEISAAVSHCPADFGGIKIFMGSSTGNMKVENEATLDRLFRIRDKEILVHCEDERTIMRNLEAAESVYGENIPFRAHPEIRSREACILSSGKALELAVKYGTRLHLLHVSTRDEIEMLRKAKVGDSMITGETSVNYLWFCDRDYSTLGSRIKCNPAIKSADDRDALRAGLKAGTVDTVGSDHAPHLATEKDRDYIHAPSGIPSIQHSLQVLLTVAAQEDIPLTRIAAAFSEKTAEIFHIQDRGYLKEGNFADIVIVDTDAEITATGEGLLYRCGWSPYEGYRLKGPVDTVFVNGETVVSDGMITGNPAGQRLVFKRLNSKRTADNI